MAQAEWMIYGAYGYTGELVAREALQRGHRPLLAGRSAAKLQPLAAELGLPHRVVDLGDAPALERALSEVALVFHAAGPFIHTSDVMVSACLAAGVHYVDVTGELPVFARNFERDAAARQRGIVLLSGAGFDVVPTDCLARYVSDAVPGASELEIAFGGSGKPSAGTAKSSFEGMLRGGFVRREGKLVPLAFGKGARRVRFSDRERPVLPIPWGDLETAYRTTSIPNITTYMAMPEGAARLLERTQPLPTLAMPVVRRVLGTRLVKDAVMRAIERGVQGPDADERAAGRSLVWARAADARGRERQAWLETLEGYAFTAVASVRAVEHLLKGGLAGALTPALAFGADFVLEVPGTRRYDELPARADAAQ